jgi:hypothetical protein
MRLFVVVEGQTEEMFVKDLLRPHLEGRGVVTAATIVGTSKRRGSSPLTKGGGTWRRWERDIRRILGEQHQADVRLTTLFDLYGLPGGFPGLAEHGSDTDTARRCDKIEAALAGLFGDRRLIPYVQRHEFETLVLASLGSLRGLFDAPEDLSGLDALSAAISRRAPEDVDDGRDTAPSKRLLAYLPGYRKTVHGPLALADTGLATLRARCRRFHGWLSRLETLAEGAA